MNIERAILNLPVVVILAGGCAPGLEAEDAEDTDAGPVGEIGGPNVTNDDQGDGTVVTVVDATDDEAWVYLDLETGLQQQVADPMADPQWDIGFRRFHIKLNGGVSGMAGVEAAPIDGMAFEDVSVAPANGYLQDLPDGDDDNEDPEYVFAQWYDYNFMTHVLTPFEIVYVIRDADGEHYKVQIEDYYDEAGTSGYMTFRWSPLEAP